jgi:ubiquinone/menaquinone biosynthesis C-methylase UbiE
MTTGEFDPAAYKVSQEREWTETAEGWREYHEVSERHWRRVSVGLLERARVKSGQRVLDVATGIGEPALTAAGLVGPEGRIVGTDLSAAMIRIAEQRARELGLGNVTFSVTDADTAQVGSAGERVYDAVVCRWALMFFADLPGALAGIRRALKPGGWFAASVVGRADRYPLVATVVGAILGTLEVAPPSMPPPGQPGFFSLSDPVALRGALVSGGFADVSVEPFELVYEFISGEELADWQFAISAPVNALLAQVPQRRAAARAAVARAAEQFRASDGMIRFPPTENWYASGRNPG